MALTNEEKSRVFEEEKLRQEMAGKSVLVAIILSFFVPGLGDLYCGSWVKAIIFFTLLFLSFILMFVGVGFFLYAIVWFCGLISAWLSASKSARRKLKKVERALTQEG